MNCVGCEEDKDVSVYLELPVCKLCKRKLDSEQTRIVVERWIKKTNSNYLSALMACELLHPIGARHSLDETLQKGLYAQLTLIQNKIERLAENKKILQDHPSVRLYYLMK